MIVNRHDREILRSLAERYSEIAQLDIQQERIDRYRKTIAMEEPRPVVLLDEIPWGEIRDEELQNRCENRDVSWIERRLRRVLYQWDHFQVDMVVPPEFRIDKKIVSSGIGIEIQETQLKGDTGTYVVSHEYTDQLATEEDLEKITLPTLTYDRENTERAVDIATDVFNGLLPVETVGTTISYHIWDRIAVYRGVDNLLIDLAARPDFMHRTARKFADICASMITQLLEQNLLETQPLLLHCTPAYTDELPADDYSGTVRVSDTWGRCSAQIFSAVSPEMHDEFDLQYNQELFGNFGLLYYGCCEPLDTKVDILRKRFPNLRKISITPWADPDRAADNIGGDFVLAAKANPAFVNSPRFDPEPVEREIATYMEACKRNGTTCELVLKDISTIANNPNNLTQWAKTVEKVINRYMS